MKGIFLKKADYNSGIYLSDIACVSVLSQDLRKLSLLAKFSLNSLRVCQVLYFTD